MAIYTFKCTKCLLVFEVQHGFDEPHPERCECGGELLRVFNMPNIVYRAGGFQTTDARLERDTTDIDE
jgi:putative FmdB family regulatory protein